MQRNDCRNVKLAQARKERNWTQSDVAEKLDIDVRSVGRWEAGKAYPSPYARIQICKLFGISEEELGFIKQENPNTEEEELVTPAELFSTEHTPSSCEPQTSETPAAPVNDPEQATEQEKHYPHHTLLLAFGTAAGTGTEVLSPSHGQPTQATLPQNPEMIQLADDGDKEEKLIEEEKQVQPH